MSYHFNLSPMNDKFLIYSLQLLSIDLRLSLEIKEFMKMNVFECNCDM